jgi:FkbM family methyltransferase
MCKLLRGWEIHREEGTLTLVIKSTDYIKTKIQNKFWSKYYIFKSSIFGNYIVDINNTLIDLDDEVYSPAMKKRLRRKLYERTEEELINKYIYRDQPVIDLGAGVGYTACVIDRNTDDSTPILAVEANKSLIPVIKRTKSLNKSDFDILYSAYNSEKDSILFGVAENFWSSSQHSREDRDQTKVIVPAISLNKIIKEYNLKNPIQLVVDIEGGEHDLIDNEHHILQNEVSQIICEYHSFANEELSYYSDILEENGFEFVESQGNVYVHRNTNI